LENQSKLDKSRIQDLEKEVQRLKNINQGKVSMITEDNIQIPNEEPTINFTINSAEQVPLTSIMDNSMGDLYQNYY